MEAFAHCKQDISHQCDPGRTVCDLNTTTVQTAARRVNVTHISDGADSGGHCAVHVKRVSHEQCMCDDSKGTNWEKLQKL